MQYIGIDWETYKAVSEEIRESRSPHIIYNKGILTIMPLSDLHEFLVRFLERLITMVSLSEQKNILPTGSATLRSKTKLIAIEPDLSYFVDKAGIHRIKDYVPEEVEAPPDIVVEIDVHHSSGDKFEIYSKLGVSELWLYDGELMKMFKLNTKQTYEQTERSKNLPILNSEILTEFLSRGQEEESQRELLIEFQTSLQNAK